MKRILTILFTLVFLQNVCFASQQSISFVYINGSNNNDEHMKNWYENGVKKLHPTLKKKFETNKDTKPFYNTKTGLYHINKSPVIFFWGDKSKNELDWVKQQLEYAKVALSLTVAPHVRSMITAYFHDAIWVQKNHNMIPILENLNQVVKNEAEKGNRVALFGYSAGTFITYQYLLNKMPYLNPSDLFDAVNVSEEIREFIDNNPQKNTCISALEDAKIGVVSETGHLVLDNSQNFKKNYLNLNNSTEKVCAPENVITGVVNFASPLVLFYSDLADPQYEMNYYKAFMSKYILEHGIAFLTINFREDPLGFPTTKNLTNDEIEQVTGLLLNNPTGIIYDNSRVWSKRSVLFAHTSYWKSKGTFSNAIVKTYVEGNKFNYDKEYQKKMLKKRDKDFNIWQ